MSLIGDQDRLAAALEFIRRCGAANVSIRFQDDDEPVVWMVVASFHVDADDRPTNGTYVDVRHEVDASLNPFRAALRLCERLAEGGVCTHCHRPTALDPDTLDTMPLNREVCWYQYDPELKKFRRGCEGDTP